MAYREERCRDEAGSARDGDQIAAVGKAVDRAGFATISIGLRQCVSDPDGSMDVAAMEKLFLSLA